MSVEPPPGVGCLIGTFICEAIIFLILALYALFANSLVLAIVCFCLIPVGPIWYFAVMQPYIKKRMK